MNYQDIRPIIVPISFLFHVPSFLYDQLHDFYLFGLSSSQGRSLKSHVEENQASLNHKDVLALLVTSLA